MGPQDKGGDKENFGGDDARASDEMRALRAYVRDLEEKKGMLEDKMHSMLSRSNAEAGGAFAYDDEAAAVGDVGAGEDGAAADLLNEGRARRGLQRASGSQSVGEREGNLAGSYLDSATVPVAGAAGSDGAVLSQRPRSRSRRRKEDEDDDEGYGGEEKPRRRRKKSKDKRSKGEKGDKGRDSLERLTAGRPSSSQSQGKERGEGGRSASRSRSKERKEKAGGAAKTEERPAWGVGGKPKDKEALARAREAREAERIYDHAKALALSGMEEAETGGGGGRRTQRAQEGVDILVLDTADSNYPSGAPTAATAASGLTAGTNNTGILQPGDDELVVEEDPAAPGGVSREEREQIAAQRDEVQKIYEGAKHMALASMEDQVYQASLPELEGGFGSPSRGGGGGVTGLTAGGDEDLRDLSAGADQIYEEAKSLALSALDGEAAGQVGSNSFVENAEAMASAELGDDAARAQSHELNRAYEDAKNSALDSLTRGRGPVPVDDGGAKKSGGRRKKSPKGARKDEAEPSSADTNKGTVGAGTARGKELGPSPLLGNVKSGNTATSVLFFSLTPARKSVQPAAIFASLKALQLEGCMFAETYEAISQGGASVVLVEATLSHKSSVRADKLSKVSGWGVYCYDFLLLHDFLLLPIAPSVSCSCSDALNTPSSELPLSPAVSLRLPMSTTRLTLLLNPSPQR